MNHRTRSKTRLTTLALAAALALGATPAQPATLYFSGLPSSPNSWESSGYWSGGKLPGADSDVLLRSCGTCTTEWDSRVRSTFVINSFTGGGKLTLDDNANLSIAAASSIGSLDITAATGLKGGQLTGAGTLTVSGASTWSYGGMSGTGSTTFQSGVAISNSAAKALDVRKLTLAGASSWIGDGSLTLSNGAVLTNNGSFDDQNAVAANILNVGSSNSFVNAGTYTKSGTGTTTINTAFTNSGTLAVNGGNLVLAGAGRWVGDGAITVNNGALTNNGSFNDANTGAASLNGSGAGSGFVNAGTYTKTGVGTTAISTALINNGTLVQQYGAGALNLYGGISGDGSVTVNGTMNIVGNNSSMGSLSLNGGLLSVAGELTVSKASSWSDGTMSGSITFDKGLTIAGAPTQNNATLWLNGSINWVVGNITLSNGSQFNNNGSFTDNSLGGYVNVSGTGSNIFGNGGTYTRSNIGTTTVNADFINSGTLTVNKGTMKLNRGINSIGGITDVGLPGGSVSVASGATLVLGAVSLTRNISIAGTAPDMLTLGANNLLVQEDYNNANFGVGNAFNRRNGVSGTGEIRALGVGTHNALQTLSGDGIWIGDEAKANVVLTLPNTRVGGAAISTSFKINNAGDAGPRLRGAIKTIGITTAALSGSGVTAQNWGALAYGTSSGAYTITYAPTAAGNVLAGQKLAIVNNFDNIAGQTLSFAGGLAYNAALPSVLSPNPVTLAAQRVGGSQSHSLTLSNLAPAGTYSEKLNASVSAGAGTTAGGSVSLLAAGSSSQALWVGVNTSTAGLKSGTVSVALASDGQGTSGLSKLALTGQQVQVSGKVYAPAVAQLGSSMLDLGIVHVGDTVASDITVRNAATVAALNDQLLGWASGGGDGFLVSGGLGGLAAGGQDSSSLKVGLNTSQAGLFNGTATLTFASHNADMSDLALGSQQVALKAQVNNYAELVLGQAGGDGSFFGAGAVYTLDFGTLTQGAAGVGAILKVGNRAAGVADLLSLRFDLGTAASHFSLNGFGAIDGLGAGAVRSLQIGFSGLLAGQFDEVVTLHAIGSNASGYAGALADVQLHLVGEVAAVPELASWAQFGLGLVGMVGFMARRRMGRRESAHAGR